MAPPLIQLKDIRLTFGGTPLLSGVELSVSPAERVCLIGRNGSGKSTLLKIAAGLVEPDSGSRFVQPGSTIRYLPQEPDFAGHATTLAYVEAGLGPGDDRYAARYLLEQLGLRGDEDPANLSGGEARRAALARVLAPSPDILLLDEPTNHLDLPTIEWLERELDSRRSALVLISHDRRFLGQSVARHRLARPRPDQADRPRLCRVRSPGATRCWPRKSASSTSSTARSSTRSTGCATASPAAASATSSGSPISMRCAQSRRNYRGAAGSAKLAAAEAEKSGRLVIEAKGIGKSLWRAQDRREFLDPRSSAATASALSGRTAPARPRW